MKIPSLFAGIITTGLLCSLIRRESLQSHEADWLLGTWKHQTANGILYESWEKVSSIEFSGKSYKLRDKDTIVFENIQLIKKNNTLYYIPTVNGQNSNKPVSFALTRKAANRLVFENRAHDFPQTITYTRISSDSLFAEVSGTSKGIFKKQQFGMRKVNH